MNDIKEKAPERIWLQPGCGDDGYGLNATWHSEPIGEPEIEEVEYVRVDPHPESNTVARLKRLLEGMRALYAVGALGAITIDDDEKTIIDALTLIAFQRQEIKRLKTLSDIWDTVRVRQAEDRLAAAIKALEAMTATINGSGYSNEFVTFTKG